MNPLSSELPFHAHNWLIISLKYFCIVTVIRKWPTFWPSKIKRGFNAAKCNIMRVSRIRLPFLYSYKLSGQILDEVKDSKYLGVTISDNLDWSKHITTTTTKANARL